MSATSDPLLILVAGPYRSGTDGDPAKIQANVDAMAATALELFERGHLPVMGEWFALPLIEAAEAAGTYRDADAEIFHPIASEGADRMVRVAGELGKRVFFDIGDVP